MESSEIGVLNASCKVSALSQEKLVLDTTEPVIEKVTSLDVTTVNGKYTFQSFLRVCNTFIIRYQQLPFLRYRISFLVLLCAITWACPGFFTGILWGIYFSFIAFLLCCVSDPLPSSIVTQEYCEELIQQIEAETKKEEERKYVYKGWMNILNDSYRHNSFHINHVQSVLVVLEENKLRVLHPERSVLKHAFHTDPSLTEPEPKMMAETSYDLVNATVKLRPKRLARRRWFSRRYPICIKFSVDPERKATNGTQVILHRSNTLDNITTFAKKALRKKSKSKSNTPDKKSESSDLVEYGREADIFLSDESTTESDIEDESSEDRSLHSVSVQNIAGDTLVRLHGIPNPKPKNAKCIYLFARSAREKERWFHRLRRACSRFSTKPSSVEDSSFGQASGQALQRRLRRTLSLPEGDGEPIPLELTKDYFLYLLHNMQFSRHLSEILGAEFSSESEPTTSADGHTVFMDLGRNSWDIPKDSSSHELVIVANLIASRIFYDFCRDAYWCKAVQNKIQTKLATIHLPYFIETLELSSFNVGTAIPKIVKVYKPSVDDWGTWIDFELKYEGCIRLTLETKVNLLRLKDSQDRDRLSESGDFQPSPVEAARMLPSRYFDEEIPESPESSPDEDFGSKLKLNEVSTRKKTGKKILNWIDKLSHSNFFKEVAEWKPVQNLMTEISSTRLILNVEVTVLEGHATMNLPPPPSDRLWYGFRKPPMMSVKAVPQVGDRPVVLSTVSEWIENKLKLLVEKNLVVPNLDDVVVPVLAGNELLQGPLNR